MILDELAAAARNRTLKDQEKIPLEQMKQRALDKKLEGFPFEKALSKEGVSFICELKKASPSKGLIAADFNPLQLASEYESAGADCLSILTEPQWFLGSDEILRQVAEVSSLPILRKDFIVDEYMIYQARDLGASAVLFIVSILDEGQLKRFLKIADELGLSALVETHNEKEIELALKCNARIIGVNNRDLRNFSVDMDHAKNLSSLIPDSVLFISESGIKDADDVAQCQQAGADAVLIGETLMRAKDKKEKLNELKSGLA